MKEIFRTKILFAFLIATMIVNSVFTNTVNSSKNDDSYIDSDFSKTTIFNKLEPGDIVFCEIRDIWVLLGGHDVKQGFDHVAIYRGKGHINIKGEFIEDKIFGKHYVIESTYFPFPKVRYTPLSLLFFYSKLYYATVNTTNETVKNTAIEFAESQLGCSYQHFFYMSKKDNPRFMWDYKKWDKNNPAYKFRKHANYDPNDPLDPLSDWYYCADLVWASYYNAGVNLDPIFPEDLDGDAQPDIIEDYGFLRFVSPQNIYDSSNTTIT